MYCEIGVCTYVKDYSWFGCCIGSECNMYTACVQRQSINECLSNPSCYNDPYVTAW